MCFFLVSPIWLPKHELNKDNSNKHASVDGEKPHEASTLHKEL